MTTFDRFDPFERRIGEALDGIAPPRRLDYLDDVFRQTARSRQRPRWSFPERWLNVDTTLARPMLFGRPVPYRSILVLVVIAALLAVTAAIYVVGSHRPAPPYGPAGNGQIAYIANGDIYIRASLNDPGHPLISRPLDQFAASFSPDGTRLAFAETDAAGDHFILANADGTHPVEVALVPPTGNAQAAWAPDGRSIALVYDVLGLPQLSIASVDGGAARVIALPGLDPWDIAWQPPSGEALLIRAEDSSGYQDLYTLRPDGSGLKAFGLKAVSDFGAQFTLSGPTWSPDGKTIAYNGTDIGRGPLNEAVQHFRIHLVSADGSNDRALPGPTDARVQENWPAWSPDGQSIAVVHWQFTDSVPGTHAVLAVLPADGSSPAREIGPRFDSAAEDAGLEKAWSPDGTRILLFAGSTGQVFSVDPISGQYEELPWAQTLPEWQRVAR